MEEGADVHSDAAFSVSPIIWEQAKLCAAKRLSKSHSKQKQKSGTLKKLLCRSRTSSDVERVQHEEMIKYLQLIDCSPLNTRTMNEGDHRRKFAVSEMGKSDREMVYTTIKSYKQFVALKACELW